MVKVWTLGTGSEGECVHELSCNGNKFQSCVFHPAYPSLLVIGCYQVKLKSLQYLFKKVCEESNAKIPNLLLNLCVYACSL